MCFIQRSVSFDCCLTDDKFNTINSNDQRKTRCFEYLQCVCFCGFNNLIFCGFKIIYSIRSLKTHEDVLFILPVSFVIFLVIL